MPKIKTKEIFDEDKRKRFTYHIRVENELLYSKAFLSLSANAIKVYLWSLMKRRNWNKADMKSRKKAGIPEPKQPPFSFTFGEIECFGIHRRRFSDTIRELVDVGLFDVEHKGGGKEGNFSLYSWSERWKHYGTKKFIAVDFPENLRYLPRDDKSGKWNSTRPPKPKIVPVEAMAILRNRDKVVPGIRCKKGPYQGQKYPWLDGYQGQNRPWGQGQNCPLEKSIRGLIL